MLNDLIMETWCGQWLVLSLVHFKEVLEPVPVDNGWLLDICFDKASSHINIHSLLTYELNELLCSNRPVYPSFDGCVQKLEILIPQTLLDGWLDRLK